MQTTADNSRQQTKINNGLGAKPCLAVATTEVASWWQWWRKRQRRRQQWQRHCGSGGSARGSGSASSGSGIMAVWRLQKQRWCQQWQQHHGGGGGDRDSGGTGSGIGRGCTGEFSRMKTEKSFGSTYARKINAKKRHKAQFVPPPKSVISTFNNGGQYPPKVIIT